MFVYAMEMSAGDFYCFCKIKLNEFVLNNHRANQGLCFKCSNFDTLYSDSIILYCCN